MTPSTIRRWSWLHKWSSLVCTVFMLLLCITGLPLIFHHEITGLLGHEVQAQEMAADTPRASIDQIIASAQTLHPGKVMMYISREIDEDRIWNVTVGDFVNDENFTPMAIDARTAKVVSQANFEGTLMWYVFRLHVDLFAGLWGMLFLGFMGMLLLLAIISGVVLYAPFMRKLEFGTVRRERAKRLKWLDMHNLLGIVTLVWALVVGTTGVINTWADLLLEYWQTDQMAEMVAPYRGLPVPIKLASVQASLEAAQKLEPGMQLAFIAWPGTPFTSPHHYGVYMRGTDPLTSRLFKPVLVDAQTAQVTDSRSLPWYLTTLLISQPLHFGDYGGRAMQILWTLLDLATIVVLGSGLYLWRQRAVSARKAAL